MKIFTISRRDQILLYKKLRDKCKIQFPFPDEMKKYRPTEINRLRGKRAKSSREFQSVDSFKSGGIAINSFLEKKKDIILTPRSPIASSITDSRSYNPHNMILQEENVSRKTSLWVTKDQTRERDKSTSTLPRTRSNLND